MNNQTLLGFDYGEKRIGVAVGQTVTQSANPLTTVPVHRNKPDWKTITQLVEKWKPDMILVGLPLQLDGSRQEMTNMAEKFMRQLSSRYHLPVEAVDERLSSFEARERLSAKSEIDPVAAQVIIETWLYEQTMTTTKNKTH